MRMKPYHWHWKVYFLLICAIAIGLLTASCATRTPSSSDGGIGIVTDSPQFDGEYAVFVTRRGALQRFIDRELNIVCYLWTNETFRCMPIGQGREDER